MTRFRLGSALIALAALASCVAVRADDESRRFHLFARRHQKKEGTPPPGAPRDIPNTDERAGYPRTFSDHLEPSATSGGIGYYVGGGSSFWRGRREGPYRWEGTWGWDETGASHFRRRVVLGWSHGRRYQGGAGAYRVDGRTPPDVVFLGSGILGNPTRRQGGEAGE